jgi:hypothetical protein
MAIPLSTLLVRAGKTAIYNTALAVAEAVGLPVDTWQAGDPTRSYYHLESEILAELEDLAIGFISSGFLDHAEDDWREILAEQVYGVEVPEPTHATTDVVLTNGGGGNYSGIEAGDLTFKNSTTDKTYTNTTGGDLLSGPGTTLTVTVVADEAGSESSAAAGEIDELVTTLLGVTCTNPTAAVGVDSWDRATTIQQCRDKLGSFSPNGPREAYSYVARNSELTGTDVVTRVRVYADSDTGDVTVYLAGAAGSVAEADRALVEEAILTWATPLCITPTVLSATPVVVPITYQLWVYKRLGKTAAEIEEEVEEALETMFAGRPIGGDIITPATTGKLYRSLIESTIRGLYAEADAFRVSVSLPTDDPDIDNNEVATLGTITATVTIERDP